MGAPGLDYEIVIQSPAMDDLWGLRAHDRAKVLGRIHEILSTNPTLEGKSRIKRLRETERPQFRLRVDRLRVLYGVRENKVLIIRVLLKDRVWEYLRELGYEPNQG